MIEGLKLYAEYKESDIPWARELPSGWKTERAKRLFTKMQRPVRPEDEVVTCFRDGMVTLRKNRRLRGFTEATAESGYQGIRKGDLVIHGMDAFAGAIGVSDSDGKGTPVYNVCQPCPGVIARYYAHTVREMSRAQWILALAKGIRERSTDFRYEMFGNQFVPLPPPDEQAAIVRFLDHANRKIDGFIRAKRKLIGLLNEQKQAIIHRAVTCGLDPNVPLKRSGIPWLGDIPAHWEVKRMKFVVDHYGPGIQMGPFGSSLTSLKSQCTGFKLYGQENTISGDFSRGNRWLTREQFDQLRKYELLPGDIVLTRKGSIGKARIVPAGIEKGIADSDTIRVRLDKRHVDPTFVVEVLHTSTYILRQLEMSRRGAVLGGLNTTTIGDILLVLPPLEYQPELLKGLHTAALPLNTAIARTEREIALMQEYRTRLTADIVTGKLDVRVAAVKLPDLPTDAAAEALGEETLDDTGILEEVEPEEF